MKLGGRGAALLLGAASLLAGADDLPPRHENAMQIEWLTNYEIELAIDPEDWDRAAFEVRFDHDTTFLPKRQAFKFFGTRTLEQVDVRDGHGRPLKFDQPGGFNEQRVDWTPPERDEGERIQTSIVSFELDLDPQYEWGRRFLPLPWAHRFKIPVDAMRVSARVPGPVEAADGFSCVPESTMFRCTRARPEGAFEVDSLPLGPHDDSLPLYVLASTLLAYLIFAAVQLLRLWQRYREWYVPRPLLTAKAAKPGQAPRIPGLLPSAPEPESVPGEWRRDFWLTQVSVVFAPLLGVGLMAWSGRSEIPMGWSVLIVGVLSIAAACPHLLGFRTPYSALTVYVATVFAWLAAVIYLLSPYFAMFVFWPVMAIATMVMMVESSKQRRSRPITAAEAVEAARVSAERAEKQRLEDLRRAAMPKPAYKPSSYKPSSYKPAYQSYSSSSSSSSSYDYDSFSSCGGGSSCGGCGG